MNTLKISLLSIVFVFLFFSISWAASAQTLHFVQCLLLHSENPTSMSKIIYTPNNPAFQSTLLISVQNLRFTSPNTPEPEVIVTPVKESQIRAVIYCSKTHGMQLRIRSGGHDYEGLSYRSLSRVPFVILDMCNLRSININVKKGTAWLHAGANLGELYYAMANKSRTIGFPAGEWPTVGVGGHFSGGGYGSLMRQHGLSADNIIDARLMDVNGRILNRTSMGEDLFWAIRGGGADSFGVVLAWKIKLATVTETLTLCATVRTLEQNLTKIIHKWQYVAPKFPKDLVLAVHLSTVNSTEDFMPTVQATFQTVFYGNVSTVVPFMQESFPELGLVEEECNEMSYIQSILYFCGFSTDDPPAVLLNRSAPAKTYSKTKSDFVTEPIPEQGFEGLWDCFLDIGVGAPSHLWAPLGGKMDEISEYSIPFPYRAGYLFVMQEVVYWDGESGAESPESINWIRNQYDYLAPYVSKSPRAAYLNFKDLDLGINDAAGNTSYEQAKIWGTHYFNVNFDRLVQVKTEVDPDNFFRNEQSIAPLPSLSDM